MNASSPNKVPHILFLFSDTGGGHRSAATAIIGALEAEFSGQATWEMLDFFKHYAPPPFDTAPDTYAPMAQIPDLWELGFIASNQRITARAIQRVLWPYVRKAVARLIAEHPCDMLLSVHPIINTPLLRGLPKDRPPYLVVVTDMVSTHQWWYTPQADLTIVPTEEARQRGISLGLDPKRMHVVGLPIARQFAAPMAKPQARNKLELPQDIPLVLMVSGGEGMGPLEETVRAIINQRVPVGMVIITGKNADLKARLESLDFPYPAAIRGFVDNMPDSMQACDVNITKAGPGTIREAFTAGLPILLYSKMPGQEDGNVDYVVNHEAGVWMDDPAGVAETLQRWIDNPVEMRKFSQNSLNLARPDSSKIIAQTAMAMLGRYPFEQIHYYDQS